ncbi:MAG: hypothetical protein ACMUJM_20085 [bacterium]
MGEGKKVNKKVTIYGYVRLADEDDEEKGLILSSDEEDYILLLNKKSEELQDMVGEEVRITGTLSSDSKGYPQISVITYESLEYDDEEYDDDDDYRHKDYDDDDEDEDDYY